jgi:hypothetical protein
VGVFPDSVPKAITVDTISERIRASLYRPVYTWGIAQMIHDDGRVRCASVQCAQIKMISQKNVPKRSHALDIVMVFMLEWADPEACRVDEPSCTAYGTSCEALKTLKFW